MVRGRAYGHPPRRTLFPYKMHVAPTLTSEFGFNSRRDWTLDASGLSPTFSRPGPCSVARHDGLYKGTCS